MTGKLITTTERLELREFSLEDTTDFFNLNSDPVVLEYTGDVAFSTPKETEDFIKNYDHYRRYGYGRWSLFRRDTNQYIGFCGLRYNESKQETDIGFRIFQSEWGKGYATESARTVIQLGFDRYQLDRIVANAMVQNVGSHSVVRKLGMKRLTQVLESDNYWVKYQILKT